MFIIYILVIAMIAMARKPAKRRVNFANYLRGSIDEEVSLTTLAAATLTSAPFDETVTETTRISTIIVAASLSNWTDIANAGPILFGVSHSDYTEAEVEEYIEQTASWSAADLVGKEVSGRKIRRIGVIGGGATAAEAAVWNDGRGRKFKLNWTLNTGQGLRLWAYNLGSAAVATTVPVLELTGHANLWLK